MKRRVGLGCLFIDRLIVCSELPCGQLGLQDEDITIGLSVGLHSSSQEMHTTGSTWNGYTASRVASGFLTVHRGPTSNLDECGLDLLGWETSEEPLLG